MKLEFIALDKLSVSKANMRYAKRAPDVADILPTVRTRGILQPLIVRPNCQEGHYEILGGARRYHAALTVADERREGGGEADPVPCAILEDTDDAAAVEASLIENLARLDPDEVTQWQTFTRLVKEGRSIDDIGATFGLPEAMIRRILALGNLVPRIRSLYQSGKIDAATVRHLTMATKQQQTAWLALHDDPQSYAPSGPALKSWLFGGSSIPARHALFEVEHFTGSLVADLFGEDRYFADPEQFWAAQNDAIAARQAAYLEAGWREVIVIPPAEHFQHWEYEKAPKRKGGRVYIDVRASGEVSFHEGYLTRSEARRIERGEADQPGAKPMRPELTGPMQTYIDLHRHAAVRATLASQPAVALRLLVAHAIVGSHLWRVVPEPQSARNDAIAESLETSRGETEFDKKRRAVLDLLGFSADEPTVTGGNGDDFGLVGVFERLIDLPDPAVMEVIAIVVGETLASGGAIIEAVGMHIGVAMADWWQADDALLDLIRDREVLLAMVAEVAGATVASANVGEKAKTLRTIIRDHLEGKNCRRKTERWVPRWMEFPPSAYTARGGVGTVAAHAKARAARPEPDPEPERLAA